MTPSSFFAFYHSFKKLDGLFFWGATLGSIFISFIIYYLHDPWTTDLGSHAHVIASETILWQPIYFFYSLVINSLIGFSGDGIQAYKAMIIVLSVWAGLKTFFSLHYSKLDLQKNNHINLFLVFCLTSVGFITLLPIFLPDWYMGKIFPNLWHNPSINFTIPFCITAFFSAVSYLEHYSLKSLLVFGLSCLVILLSKPSFFFCLAPIFPIFCLARYRFQTPFWMASLVILIGGSILIWEVFGLYNPLEMLSDASELTPSGSNEASKDASKSGIELGFFVVWRTYTNGLLSLVFSFILSFLLPLTYVICYFREAIYDLKLQFASALMSVAVFIFSFISHTGNSQQHANFSWQNIPASYLLHLVVMIGFLHILKKQNYQFQRRDIVFLGLYGLHFVSGVIYILRLVFWGEYY